MDVGNYLWTIKDSGPSVGHQGQMGQINIMVKIIRLGLLSNVLTMDAILKSKIVNLIKHGQTAQVYHNIISGHD